MLTNQTAFDTVANHLLTQNEKALSNIGDCVYRDPEGLSCAAGCLIPDDIYDPKMEGRTISAVLNGTPALKNILENVDPDLLDELQNTHDWHSVSEWPDQLAEIATKWKLNYVHSLNTDCLHAFVPTSTAPDEESNDTGR